MRIQENELSDPRRFLTGHAAGQMRRHISAEQIICAQGDFTDSVFYVESGLVKMSIVSSGGKEGVLSLRGEGDFFGVRAMIGRNRRVATATALTDCTIVETTTSAMTRLLREEPNFALLYAAFLMRQHVHDQENLADLLTNSAEKRLARVLLRLANFGHRDDPGLGNAEPIATRISQETLAEMVGTTRSRVNFFMNKFRQLGLIEYKDKLVVHRSLADILQRE